MQEPITHRRRMETLMWMSSTIKDMINSVVALMVDIPTASPSSPSIRLMALVQPTIQIIVTRMEIGWLR